MTYRAVTRQARPWRLPFLAGGALALALMAYHDVSDGIEIMAGVLAAAGVVALSALGSSTVDSAIAPPFPEPGDGVRVPPLRRLLALAAGAAVSGAVAVAAAVMSGILPADGTAHAVTLVVLVANLGLASTVVLTMPPFKGWLLLLAIVDLFGASTHDRMRRARRFGRAWVVALSALVAAGFALIGLGHAAPLAILLGWYGWSATTAAEAVHVLRSYLRDRRAADVAHPIRVHLRGPDEVEPDALGDNSASVALVLSGFETIGAVGPRQLRVVAHDRPPARWEEIMVPIAAVDIVPGDAPAPQLLRLLGPHGFALVQDRGAVSYVEEQGLLVTAAMVIDLRHWLGDESGWRL